MFALIMVLILNVNIQIWLLYSALVNALDTHFLVYAVEIKRKEISLGQLA